MIPLMVRRAAQRAARWRVLEVVVAWWRGLYRCVDCGAPGALERVVRRDGPGYVEALACEACAERGDGEARIN